MSKLSKPTNDWAKSLWIIQQNYIGGVNMTKVLTQYDPTFWKFQSRISDICREHPKFKDKLQKTDVPFKSKITGKSGYTTWYTPLHTPNYLKNLYNKINSEGLKHNKKQ